MRYDISHIGSKIKKLRKQNGLSQMQLAVKANLGVHTVHQWEQNIAYPSLMSIIILCDVLDCKFEDLVERKVTK